MSEHVIGTLDEFPEGKGTDVEVAGLRVAVFNLDGDLYAVSGTCPHKGAPLALAGSDKITGEGWQETDSVRGSIDESKRTIGCPWHRLTFDLKSGECPIARYRLRSFEVVVEDGTVTLVV